jgi:hypothetical protein
MSETTAECLRIKLSVLAIAARRGNRDYLERVYPYSSMGVDMDNVLSRLRGRWRALRARPENADVESLVVQRALASNIEK